MGNRPSSGAESSDVAEIFQSPRTEDEAKIANGYTTRAQTHCKFTATTRVHFKLILHFVFGSFTEVDSVQILGNKHSWQRRNKPWGQKISDDANDYTSPQIRKMYATQIHYLFVARTYNAWL